MNEDRYEIIKLLGKGRTGGVYEAVDSVLGRKVALRRFFAQRSEINVDTYKKEFQEVAHSLSALQHPNLLRVYDAGVDNEGAYIISQLLSGTSLNNQIATGGPMPYWEVNDMAQQMLDALSTAHVEGFVHGAITPGSILLTPRARGGFLYVILDMGLSRLAPLIQGKDSILATMADPAILAPELFDGSKATERGDLYMIGQIIYMSLAGGHPFGGVSAKEAQRMHQEGLPPIQEFVHDLPEGFCLWLEKLVQISPDQRPVSALEALNTLPRVMRPAIHHTAVVQTATPQVVNTAQTPRQITGGMQLTAHTVIAGTGVLRLPPAKTDPKKIMFIGLALLAFLVAIIITVIFYKKNSAKMESKLKETTKDTPEEVVRFTPKENPPSNPKQDTKPSETITPKPNLNINELPKGSIAYFEGASASVENPKGWVYTYKRTHKAIDDGWSMRSTNHMAITGINFPLPSKVNDMFNLGWKLTYVVRPITGKHRFGLNFDNTLNPGWAGDKTSLSLLLELTANKEVKLFAMDSSSQSKIDKSIMVPYKGEQGWYNIVIEQKAKDKSGAYTVTIDGKLAFEDTFTQNIEFGEWKNSLYSLSYPKSLGDEWAIKEMRLETF